MEDYIDTTILYKAVTELASWVSNHIDSADKTTVNIHFFSNVADAEEYLKNSGKKLTILVAQDYFTDDGCHSSRYATRGAHDDFIRLARSSLGDNCRYFELIKNDLKEEVYSQKGTVNANRDIPLSTKLWSCANNRSKIYENVPFAFFVNPENDTRPESNIRVERKYNEQAEIITVKRY